MTCDSNSQSSAQCTALGPHFLVVVATRGQHESTWPWTYYGTMMNYGVFQTHHHPMSEYVKVWKRGPQHAREVKFSAQLDRSRSPQSGTKSYRPCDWEISQTNGPIQLDVTKSMTWIMPCEVLLKIWGMINYATIRQPNLIFYLVPVLVNKLALDDLWTKDIITLLDEHTEGYQANLKGIEGQWPARVLRRLRLKGMVTSPRNLSVLIIIYSL